MAVLQRRPCRELEIWKSVGELDVSGYTFVIQSRQERLFGTEFYQVVPSNLKGSSPVPRMRDKREHRGEMAMISTVIRPWRPTEWKEAERVGILSFWKSIASRF